MNEFDENDVRANLHYLVRDPRYEHERPYELAYDAGGIIPRTNIVNESHTIQIRDFRPLQTSTSYEEYGFTSVKLDQRWTAAQIQDENLVKNSFVPQLFDILWEKFPDAVELGIYDQKVCFL